MESLVNYLALFGGFVVCCLPAIFCFVLVVWLGSKSLYPGRRYGYGHSRIFSRRRRWF